VIRIGISSSGVASGRSSQTMAQMSAIAVPTSVTAWSSPNISRTWTRETNPSVSTIAAMICAVVSTLPSCAAASTAPHVIQPKPGSMEAARCTTTISTDVTSANCARLNANLIADPRRSRSATNAPVITATNAWLPLVKMSASVSGTSVSEKECVPRRNSSSTGQRSVMKTMMPSTHHQPTWVPRIGSRPRIQARYSTAAAVPMRAFRRHTGSMELRLRRRVIRPLSWNVPGMTAYGAPLPRFAAPQVPLPQVPLPQVPLLQEL
jgi:hypothetical protein